MATQGQSVELGFVEKVGKLESLCSLFFPSKVGGKPSWLDLEDFPVSNLLLCNECKKPMVFLLQVYAPLSENDHCFHRTLFLFCCKNGQCYKQNSSKCFTVFRSQLEKENKFYSSKPPPDINDENLDWDKVKKDVDRFIESNNLHKLCSLCGCKADKQCSRCHAASYCSREHQTIDWKAGHKAFCKHIQDSVSWIGSPAFLFPEYELVIEQEPENEEKEEKSEEQVLKDYKQFARSHSGLQTDDKDEQEFEKLAAAGKEALIADKCFKKFQKRVQLEPEQVLRYDIGGEPLWVSDDHIPNETDIPGCSCGAKRQFEFQVMPQLLNHLKADSLEESIDWGTLAVYTCSRNCSAGPSYHPEFLWKQDFAKTESAAEILSKLNNVKNKI